ncbi:MAG TPA: hypothetical protein VMZ27_05675 [Candidatus Saccharimonadales bacterium]|nr:hypothetical protein [Candidatus Saccharimonadales bacterium]
MTAQINDEVFYRKTSYSIAGISGSGLFEPQSHAIEPVSMSSACWRGYHVEYAIEAKQLFLTRVTLGLSKKDELRAKAGHGPALFDVKPRYDEQGWGCVYAPLRVPILFSGGLLLGNRFIDQLYVHMGFHPAWKYRQVHEVLFERGQLTGELDRSSKMEELRLHLSAQPLQPGPQDSIAQMRDWIAKCFSLDYTHNPNG